jgi:hypothetical protein
MPRLSKKTIIIVFIICWRDWWHLYKLRLKKQMSVWQICWVSQRIGSIPLFNIFLHSKRNEVIKHDHTQTAVAHDWPNLSSWNKYGHAAKVTTYTLIHINEVLHYQFIHRKICALTFGTHHVYLWKLSPPSILLRTRLLWTGWWTIVFLKMQGICEQVEE